MTHRYSPTAAGANIRSSFLLFHAHLTPSPDAIANSCLPTAARANIRPLLASVTLPTPSPELLLIPPHTSCSTCTAVVVSLSLCGGPGATRESEAGGEGGSEATLIVVSAELARSSSAASAM